MRWCVVTALRCLLFVFCFPASHIYAQLSFSKSVVDSRLAGAYSVTAVDFDGDKKIDIVAGGGSNISWYKNNGNGSFSKRSIANLIGTWWVCPADVDRDGDMDVLAATPGLNEVRFFQNSGGSFRSITVGTGVNAEVVAAGDFDGDGDLDVVASDWAGNRVVRWRYDGGQRFTQFVLDSNLPGAHSVTVADFDKDGDIDIAASGSGKINWYRNGGSGSFSKVAITNTGALCIQAIDFDKDGKADIVGTGRQAGDVYWMKNNGGSFSRRTVASSFGDSWSVYAGDMDKDGDMDVVAGSINMNYVKAWINDGSNSKFKELVVDGNINSARAVWAADFDGDGDADIASAARKSAQVAWYKVGGGSSSTIASSDDDENVNESESIDAAGLPTEFSLHQNYPNPFNPTTQIDYELPETGEVRLSVFDVLGREVVTLMTGEQPAGRHSITWNGTDARGLRAASGMYFYQLHAGGFRAVRRMLLIQ
jgi:hypothetical protein